MNISPLHAQSIGLRSECITGANFSYNGREHGLATLHNTGLLTLGNHTEDTSLDCMNTAIYNHADILVALCSVETLTWVNS